MELFLLLLGEGVNFTQLMGFTCDKKNMKRITAGTGIAQVLMALFAPMIPGAGGTSTGSIVIATGEKILKAIGELAKEIGHEIKTASEQQYLARLAAAQDQLKSTIDIFLNMDSPDAVDPNVEKVLEKSFENWRLSITEPEVVSPESGILKAIEWAKANEGFDYSTFGMYLTAMGLYLNYCKLGIGLEYHEMIRAYHDAQQREPTDDDPPGQDALKKGIYYRKLCEGFDNYLKFATPKFEAILAGNQQRHAAMRDSRVNFSRFRELVARNQIFEEETKKHHLNWFVTNESIEMLTRIQRNLTAARDQWNDDLF